jgi:hypothetical protein
MKPRTQVYLMLGALIAALALSFHATACEAADRSQSIETGQPRDLINQPVCWPPDEFQEARRCELAGKL